MAKRSEASNDAPLTSRQLAGMLEQKQRLLGESADALRRCENTISECREVLDEGRDHSHFKWLALAVLPLFAGSLLMRLCLPLALICSAIGIIMALRWLVQLIHCVKKFTRTSSRLQNSLKEQDRLTEACAALRLETAELRQKLDEAQKS